jgi:hypothetical protein
LMELANAPGGAMNYYVAGLAELHRERAQQARAVSKRRSRSIRSFGRPRWK